MSAEEQRLINEAFLAVRRVQTDCRGERSHFLSAMESCGNLLSRRATVDQLARPSAQVLRLVRP